MNDSSAQSALSLSTAPLPCAAAPVRAATAEAFAWIATVGVFVYSLFWGIASFGIQDNNEGIYAEVAREMNATGNWIIPHLNGVPYVDKPPLLYWGEALLLRVFGSGEWVVRLGPIAWFAGTVAAVLWIGRQARSPALARRAVWLLCTATGIVVMSRSLLFDVPLTCAVTWALAFFLRYRLTKSRHALRAVYAALAVGVMAKGLIALVLAGAAIVITTWMAERSLRAVLRLADGMGAAIFTVIVVPWHVWAAWREPGFAEFYFINEHVRRFLGTREPHDFYTGPFYYYVIRLPMYLGVWAFALPLLIRRNIISGRSRREREAVRLLSVAAGFALAFLSFSEGKANYYLLAITPVFALLIALAWPPNGRSSARLWLCPLGLATLGVGYAVLPFLGSRSTSLGVLVAGQTLSFLIIATALVSLAVAAGWFVRHRQNEAVFVSLAAAAVVLFLPVAALLRRADGQLSQRVAASFFAAKRNDPVVLYRRYEDISSFVYYIGHPVPVVECVSNELWYARHHYPRSATFLCRRDLQAIARRRRVWLVAKSGDVDDALREFKTESARVTRRFSRIAVIALGDDSGQAPRSKAESYAAPSRPTIRVPLQAEPGTGHGPGGRWAGAPSASFRHHDVAELAIPQRERRQHEEIQRRRGDQAAIYSANLDELDAKADEIAGVLRSVPGAAGVRARPPAGAPRVGIRLRPAALTAFGLRSVAPAWTLSCVD